MRASIRPFLVIVAMTAGWGTSLATESPRPKPVVVLVTAGNFFLQRTVTALTWANSRVLTPAEYEAAGPPGADCVIFDAYQPKRNPNANRILFFGAAAPGLKLAGIPGHKPALIRDQDVKDWTRNDPLLRGLDLGKLFVAEALPLEPPAGWDVLVRGSKSPLIVRREAEGRIITVVAFRLTESNWPTQLSFPVFISRVIRPADRDDAAKPPG